MASRTDAATCPSCGEPYERRIWRWWLAIPIVVLAFGLGYFGLSKLLDDDEAGITADQSAAIELGISRSELADQLDGEAPQYSRQIGEGETATDCLYYGIVDKPESVWQFCFQDDELVTSEAIGSKQS